MLTAADASSGAKDHVQIPVQEVHVLSADIDVGRLWHGGEVVTPEQQVGDEGDRGGALSVASVNGSGTDSKALQLESLIDNLTLKSLGLHGQLRAASSRRQTADSAQGEEEGDVSEAAGRALAMAALQDEVLSLRKELRDAKSEASSLQHQVDEAIRQKIKMQDERDKFERQVKEMEQKMDTLREQLEAQRASVRRTEETLTKPTAGDNRARIPANHAITAGHVRETVECSNCHTQGRSACDGRIGSAASFWQPMHEGSGRVESPASMAMGCDSFRFSSSATDGKLNRDSGFKWQSHYGKLADGSPYAQRDMHSLAHARSGPPPVGSSPSFSSLVTPKEQHGCIVPCEHCGRSAPLQQGASIVYSAQGDLPPGDPAQRRHMAEQAPRWSGNQGMEATLAFRPTSSHHGGASQSEQCTPQNGTSPFVSRSESLSQSPMATGYFTQQTPPAYWESMGWVAEAQSIPITNQNRSGSRPGGPPTVISHAPSSVSPHHSRPNWATDGCGGGSDFRSHLQASSSPPHQQTIPCPGTTGESLDVSSVTQRGKADNDDDIPQRYNQLLQAAFEATEACKVEVGRLDASVSSGVEQQHSPTVPSAGPAAMQERGDSHSRKSPHPVRTSPEALWMQSSQACSNRSSPQPSESRQGADACSRVADDHARGRRLQSAYLLRRTSQL